MLLRPDLGSVLIPQSVLCFGIEYYDIMKESRIAHENPCNFQAQKSGIVMCYIHMYMSMIAEVSKLQARGSFLTPQCAAYLCSYAAQPGR